METAQLEEGEGAVLNYFYTLEAKTIFKSVFFVYLYVAQHSNKPL